MGAAGTENLKRALEMGAAGTENLKRALEMGASPPRLRISYNLFFLLKRHALGVGNDGCEAEFIVGHFENRICMCYQVRLESHLCGFNEQKLNFTDTFLLRFHKCSWMKIIITSNMLAPYR